ncbi:hypothetical protein PDG61_28810 [Mycolicibacterium sp. BiH015]|uniref:hypothetical protein n=1 Tax=Mycolicibacterium sp. BiH015 TaxID=3018808 RepID=UPI0022E39983|nr:hypothetical protein [Mycolicibacterium sp. BiH015]MDA2894946.1 hypothetical protein [Mycolicibacterium sp. BiH015]
MDITPTENDGTFAGSAAVVAIGLMHFVFPTAFEPLNRWLGFTENTRRYVYANGAVETAIGLLLARPGTRPISASLGAAYGLYLAVHALPAALRRASA